MDVVVLIGRILFGMMFINSGISHFTGLDNMTGYAQMKKIPMARLSVMASGALILVGGLMVVLGIWADLGALLLVAFLVPTAFLMHNFWADPDPQSKLADLVNFFKNIALAGAGLILFAFFAYAGHRLGLTVTGPLFDLD
jgi:putative oxidoreductase